MYGLGDYGTGMNRKQVLFLLDKVDAAIAAHPQLVHDPKVLDGTSFMVDRNGYEVEAYVKKGRVRGRISGKWSSFLEAANTLIRELDLWASVM